VSAGRRGRALLISENAPLPKDRRVWNEARSLAEDGWEVVAVCAAATGAQQPAREVIEGVEVHRFPLRPAAGALGYGREYAQALWRIHRLVRRLQRQRPFDLVHAASPPDFLLLAARSARRAGARLVFDHHDLTPELFRSRFGRAGIVHRVLLALERRAMRGADVVISTNESYRQIAIERGGVDPADVFVVRNGPDLERFQPVAEDPSLRRGRRYLLAYLGVMGPQDGIDHGLRALAALQGMRPDDWHAVFIGDGEVRDEMEGFAAELGLAASVEFAGWRGDDDIRRILSTADVGLEPDPPGPLNDRSTMIKVGEYMAMGCPVAAYDLAETRVTAGDAAAYAASPTPEALGRCLHELLEDPERRRQMAQYGRERVLQLSWQRSAPVLLAAYERAMSRKLQHTNAESRLDPSAAEARG
jgi:glycosyltransferase involved in cell wall biosynthesis